VAQLDAYIGAECPEYQSDLVTQILMIGDFYPLTIYVGMVFAMFFHYDVFFVCINLIIYWDLAVNYILALAVQEPGPLGTDCPWLWEMPSYHSELIVMFGSLFTFLAITKDWTVTRHSLNSSLLATFLVLFYRIYANINTPAQLYVGALVGVGNALLGYLFIWHIVVPIMPLFSSSRIAYMLGFENYFFKDRYDEFIVK
jgi:hypothetical protein